MTGQVRLTLSAEKDLSGISAQIASDNPTAAIELLRRFDRALTLYASQPLAAPIYVARPSYRYFSVGNYVVFYEPLGEGILVARVLHGARNLPDLLGL